MNAKKTNHKHSNPELARAMADLRKSSAASPHQDSRTKRARTRADAKRKAIKDHG